jgi:hypothetical protein
MMEGMEARMKRIGGKDNAVVYSSSEETNEGSASCL